MVQKIWSGWDHHSESGAWLVAETENNGWSYQEGNLEKHGFRIEAKIQCFMALQD